MGGKSLVRLFDAVTVPLGLILLLYLMFKGLFSNIFGPSGAAGVGGQGGAEALSFGDLILGNFTNPFTLAMFVLGFILWGFAVRPWVKEKLRLAREARQRAKVVEDGGYEIGLISAVLKGKAPKLALLSGLLAVPWSGPKEAPRPEGSFALVHDLDGLEGTGAKAVDLADGREVALDSTLLARLATGELVLLEAMEDPAEESGAGPEDGSAPSGPKLAFVSSALLGGRSKVQTSLETEQVAHRLSMNDGGREILTRTQVRAVKGLSKALKAPVYELDWEPELPHRSVASYVQAERGGTFFVRLKVLRALEGLPGPERTVRLREVEEYLGALRISQEAGRPLPEAYRNFMEKMPQLAQWLRSGGIVR